MADLSILILLPVGYRLLRNFRCEIQWKDTLILSLSFLLFFSAVFASTYGYLNLKMQDMILLDAAAVVFAVFFVVQFLYFRNVSYLREQERRDKEQINRMQRQFAYYQQKQRDEERVRAIYHDMKNHLLVLERGARMMTKPALDKTSDHIYGGGKTYTDISQMAQELRSQIADFEDYVHTGNEFLDIIIKDKAERAREIEIDFSVFIDFGDVDFIEPLDISTIFGNGIDNAMEACEKLPKEARMITVRAGRVRNLVSIVMENPCAPEESDRKRKTLGTFHGGTSKADTFLHGFGISNMKKAAEKYGGACTTAVKDGIFILKILLPAPELDSDADGVTDSDAAF